MWNDNECGLNWWLIKFPVHSVWFEVDTSSISFYINFIPSLYKVHVGFVCISFISSVNQVALSVWSCKLNCNCWTTSSNLSYVPIQKPSVESRSLQKRDQEQEPVPFQLHFSTFRSSIRTSTRTGASFSLTVGTFVVGGCYCFIHKFRM